MRHSFFSRFKDKLAFDYGGRFVSALLAEILIECPFLIIDIIPKLKPCRKEILSEDLSVELEYEFVGKQGRGRRADIAILIGGKPAAFIEIKYEDQKRTTRNAQIQDYLRYAKKYNTSFIFLTKYRIQSTETAALQEASKLHRCDARWITYSDLCDLASKRASSQYALKALAEFLQSEVPMFSKTIDIDALKLMILNSINTKHSHGFGRLKSGRRVLTDIPRELEKITNNVNVIADYIYERHFYNHTKQRPAVGFVIRPLFDVYSAKKALLNYEKDYIKINRVVLRKGDVDTELKSNGANLYIYATYRLKRIDVEIGYHFELTVRGRNQSPAIKPVLYACIEDRSSHLFKYENTFAYHRARFKDVSPESSYKRFGRCINRSLDKAIVIARTEGSKKQLTAELLRLRKMLNELVT